jgi:SAM-dependent methyltransferase
MTLDAGYWDSVAARTLPIHPLMAHYKRQEHIELVAKWANVQNKVVLKTDSYEEAKGTDHFFDWIARQSRQAVAMDISPRLAETAQSRFNDIRFAVGDVRKMPFADASLDVIISNSTLDHFPTSDLVLSLKECHRVLKKGASLILTLDNRDNPLKFMFYTLANWVRLMPYHREKCYSLKETVKLARDAGFDVEDHTAIVHMFLPVNTLHRFLPTAISNALISISLPCFRLLGRLPMKRFTGAFVAVLCVK